MGIGPVSRGMENIPWTKVGYLYCDMLRVTCTAAQHCTHSRVNLIMTHVHPHYFLLGQTRAIGHCKQAEAYVIASKHL